MDKNDYTYFKIILTNNNELFVQTPKNTKAKDFIKNLEKGTLSSQYFVMQQINTERKRQPVFFSKDILFSVEKIDVGMISNNNKLWKISDGNDINTITDSDQNKEDEVSE